MITSRTADKHRNCALELGVTPTSANPTRKTSCSKTSRASCALSRRRTISVRAPAILTMKSESVLAKTAKGVAAAHGEAGLSAHAATLLSTIDGRRDMKTLRRKTGGLTARDVEEAVEELVGGGYVQVLGAPASLPELSPAQENPSLLLSLDFSALRTQALNYAAEIAKMNAARGMASEGHVVEAESIPGDTDAARITQTKLEAEGPRHARHSSAASRRGGVRVKLAAALRPKIVDELRRTLAAALRPRLEAAVHAQLEAELKPRVELELRARLARQIRGYQDTSSRTERKTRHHHWLCLSLSHLKMMVRLGHSPVSARPHSRPTHRACLPE